MCEQFGTPAQVRSPRWIPSGSDPEVIAPGKGAKIAMREWIRTMRPRAAIPLMVDARQIIAGLVYLIAYVALDRVSFSESYAQLGITPWSPSTGLSFVLILLFGRRLIPLLFVAPFLADMVNRQGVLPWPAEILSVAAIGAGYSAALLFLTYDGACLPHSPRQHTATPRRCLRAPSASYLRAWGFNSTRLASTRWRFRCAHG